MRAGLILDGDSNYSVGVAGLGYRHRFGKNELGAFIYPLSKLKYHMSAFEMDGYGLTRLYIRREWSWVSMELGVEGWTVWHFKDLQFPQHEGFYLTSYEGPEVDEDMMGGAGSLPPIVGTISIGF